MFKKNMLFLAFFFLIYTTISAQIITPDDPDVILRNGEKVPQVMLLGTFHFDYPNLDAHKTAEEDQVDIESAKMQKQVEEVLDYIARFKPTKIVVERWPESNINDRYKAYLKGDFDLKKSETYQLGFRLAKRFGHAQLYPCDAGTLVRDLYQGPDSLCIRPTLDAIYEDWDFSDSTDVYDQRYDQLYNYQEQVTSQLSLLDYFKYENSPKVLKRGFGAYLVGDFKLGDHRGADALAMHFYVRNLRIFRNIQEIGATPDDRVLVIFGAGHMGFLRQLFESTPEFDLVEFGDLETWRR